MKKMLQHIALVLLLLIGLPSFAQEKEKDLVSFGGHVFTEYFPIDLGKAILYDHKQIPIDTAIIDTLGYYYFYKKVAGEYYINAQLDINDPNFGLFLPTFYPNTFYIDSAKSVEILSDNWELDIVLYRFENENTGLGNIKGSILIDDEKIAIHGIDVQVRNEFGNPFSHTQTDRFGNFEISDLPYGNFILYPQILGYTTIPYHFEISEANTELLDVQMKISNGQISSYINESIVSHNSFLCFPNPANQSINLRFDFDGSQQIQTRVLDISGRVVYEESDDSMRNYNNQLNTNDWENGYYFIEVFLNGNKAISQKVAVIH